MASGKRGIHDRINRVSHWDVNVTNLERSRLWYEKTTTLRVVASTTASQDFPALGITKGSFKGYLLRDSTKGAGYPIIHLVEWQNPLPVGKPNLSHGHVGWYRIVPVVQSIAATREAVMQQGSKPFAETTEAALQLSPNMPVLDYRVFTTHDPDGIAVEFSQADILHDLAPACPYTIAHNTANVEKNLPFYLEVLGLDVQTTVQSPHLVPNVYSPNGGQTGLTGVFFTIRNNNSYMLDWLQWTDSPKYPTPYPEANHVGIVRCAIEVDDVDAAYQILRELSGSPRHTFKMGEPEVWDFGQEFGARKVLNFQDPEGVGFQLIEQPQQPQKVDLHPWGVGSEFK